MRITDRFRNEHAAFVDALDDLRRLLDTGTQVDAFVAALRTLAAPLGDHAQREEDVLFPELAADDDARGPIRVLTEEHELIDGWIARMTDGPSPSELGALFEEFEWTLRGHIVREDSVMFPLAERILNEVELVALDAPPATVAT